MANALSWLRQLLGGGQDTQPQQPGGGIGALFDAISGSPTIQAMRAPNAGAIDLSAATGLPPAMESMMGAERAYDPTRSFAANALDPRGIEQAMNVAMSTGPGAIYHAYKGMYPYDWRTQPVSTSSGEKYWPLSHPQPELRGQKIPQNEPLSQPEPITEFNSTNGPFAGFFSDDPAVASRFASAFSPGAVYPTKLTLDNPVVIDAAGKPAGAFQFGDIAKEHGTLDELKRFLRAIHDPASPHDGVILKNTKDEGTVYVPRASSQVRSIFE